jgi:hypothetical protein
MSRSLSKKPLGEILKEAGLVYASQVELALRDQDYYPELCLGEIMALRGWIKKRTADFFADEWFAAIGQTIHHPLGYYLKQAGLLNDKQIYYILAKQKQVGLRFGSIAVLKGWLQQTTLDFFLNYLSNSAPNAFSPLSRQSNDYTTKERTFITEIITAADL